MSSVVSIVGRRWGQSARIGGIIRTRLSMGDGSSLSDCNQSSGHIIESQIKPFSSSSKGSDASAFSSYAVVDHSKAYERSMQGRHGQQLALARLEGIGKDDLPFDPFEEEERKFMVEKERKEGLEAANEDGSGDESSDESEYESDSDSDDDEEEEDEVGLYNRDGSVRRKKSVLSTLKAGYPSGGLFAIVELAGSQHKITTDDLLVVNKLKPVEKFKIGSVHTLKDVLLIGSSHLTLVGMPLVTGAEVDVMVEEITQDAKVVIFKKRRRKHSQRKKGFRRDLTLLRVLDIRMPDEYKDHDHVGRDSIDELETVNLGPGKIVDDTSHFDEGKKINFTE